METGYYPNRWLRRLDMVGMVLAPLSLSLPSFLFAVQIFPIAGSNSNDYIAIIMLIFVGLLMLISFGYLFVWGLKRYANHQLLRNEVIGMRILYTVFILTGLFLIFYFSPRF